jgi:hypothetical protein
MEISLDQINHGSHQDECLLHQTWIYTRLNLHKHGEVLPLNALTAKSEARPYLLSL